MPTSAVIAEHNETLDALKSVLKLLKQAESELSYREEVAAESDCDGEPYDNVQSAIESVEERISAISTWLSIHDKE